MIEHIVHDSKPIIAFAIIEEEMAAVEGVMASYGIRQASVF
jgi:hypothetical protein